MPRRDFAGIVPDEVRTSVGSIGFGKLDQANRSAEIGYAIGRAYWNRGIATRAGRLVVAYGLNILGLERIQALVLPDSTASIRVLEKLDFQREGILRAYRIVNGARRDYALYSLLA